MKDTTKNVKYKALSRSNGNGNGRSAWRIAFQVLLVLSVFTIVGLLAWLGESFHQASLALIEIKYRSELLQRSAATVENLATSFADESLPAVTDLIDTTTLKRMEERLEEDAKRNSNSNASDLLKNPDRTYTVRLALNVPEGTIDLKLLYMGGFCRDTNRATLVNSDIDHAHTWHEACPVLRWRIWKAGGTPSVDCYVPTKYQNEILGSRGQVWQMWRYTPPKEVGHFGRMQLARIPPWDKENLELLKQQWNNESMWFEDSCKQGYV